MTPSRPRVALFLDVDGVLNSHLFVMRRGKLKPPPYALHERLDPDAVRRLASLHDELAGHGLEVVWVLSSTWRLAEDRGREATEAALRVHAPSLRLHDETPDLEDELGLEPPRGREVARWLEAHPEVERFVILDDHDDLAPYEHRLVQTTRAVGLTDDDCRRALGLLLGG
jgi:hypothetical protein